MGSGPSRLLFNRSELADLGYEKQSQFGIGFLVGYHFGPAVLQTYLTRVVYQKNYGGYDTRLWSSIQLKLW